MGSQASLFQEGSFSKVHQKEDAPSPANRLYLHLSGPTLQGSNQQTSGDMGIHTSTPSLCRYVCSRIAASLLARQLFSGTFLLASAWTSQTLQLPLLATNERAIGVPYDPEQWKTLLAADSDIGQT